MGPNLAIPLPGPSLVPSHSVGQFKPHESLSATPSAAGTQVQAPDVSWIGRPRTRPARRRRRWRQKHSKQKQETNIQIKGNGGGTYNSEGLPAKQYWPSGGSAVSAVASRLPSAPVPTVKARNVTDEELENEERLSQEVHTFSLF